MQFQSRAKTRDGFGQRSNTWTDTFKAWVRIEPLSGRELETAQAINNEVTHRVTMRYRTTVTTDMRGVYQGRIFNVLAVLDVETAHVALQLLCSEGLNQG